MALREEDDNLKYVKTPNNCKKLNVEKEEVEGDTKNNAILNVMNNLIVTMQQLQKMFIDQSTKDDQSNFDKTFPKQNNIVLEKSPPTQTEILLQQVQQAMESTITQLSNRDKHPNNIVNDITDTITATKQQIAAPVLSISQKWRLYSEMVQGKNDTATEYCLNKMKLGQELGLSFKETKKEMLVGLWSNRLATVLFLKQQETEADILEDIEQWEKLENARYEVFKKSRNKNK